MTNSEKMAVASHNSHAMTENKVKKGIGAKTGLMAEHGTGVTFADSLHSFTAQTTKVMAPTGDVTNEELFEVGREEDEGAEEALGMRDAILLCMRKYMQNRLGEDDEERDPVHRLTEEQKEWLAASHDMEKLKDETGAEAFGAFLGDLVYLNVISSGEAFELMSPTLPLDDEHRAGLAYIEAADGLSAAGDGNILGMIARYIDEQKRELEYLSDEYFSAHHKEAELEYLRKLNDYLNNKKECYEAVWQAFDDKMASERGAAYDEKRVRDASEQLKADFGSLLTRNEIDL